MTAVLKNNLGDDNARRKAEPSFDVTVIIVSWNVAGVLSDCLDSLAPDRGKLSLEVLVVDNASSDDTLEMLRARFPWVRVIANRENCGFAQANNQGIALARGRFLMLLNPDTIVAAGALRVLFDFLTSRPAAGAVGPYLPGPNGKPGFCSARRSYSLAAALFIDALRLKPVPLIGPFLYRWLVAPYDYQQTQCVEAISGAAMLARRELLQSLGGFGETFLHGGEDLDLCFRIRKAGWEIWYDVDAVIMHLGGESSKKAQVRTTVNVAISNQQFFNRCHGAWQGLAYRCIVQVVVVPVILGIGLTKFVFRREGTTDLRQRLAIARGLLAWRPSDETT